MTESPNTSRSALVTGGNRGIGLAIARRLLADGHKVAVTCRDTPPPDERLLAVRCDVTEAASIDQAFSVVEEQQGPVEILVSNAGAIDNALLVQMEDDQFDGVIDTNLTAAYRVAKRASKPMVKARFGRLIFLGSVVGLRGAPGQVNYAAAKAGVVGIARSLTHELASRSITANVVAPGFIDTDMTAEIKPKFRQTVIDSTPVGRFGRADEVAAAVSWLASDEAAFVTGAVIPVDGGYSMGH